MAIRCSQCDGTIIEPGKIEDGDVQFLPQHAKGLTSQSQVKLEPHVCVSCGFVMWLADPEALGRKIELPDDGDPTEA